jgi:nucleotide-binding universal stress UspA family protein
MSSCYREILVAYDGSPDADGALEHAVRLARDQRARLTILTVAPSGPPSRLASCALPPLDDLFAAALARGVGIVPADVGLTTLLLRGEPADVILRTARAGSYDLIVMGSHGHGRLHRALLGSVSHRVLHDGSPPVLLIRGEAADSTDVPDRAAVPALRGGRDAR